MSSILPNNYHYADTVAPLKAKTEICFALMLVISNALKSKCRFQSADYEHKMLLVVLK